MEQQTPAHLRVANANRDLAHTLSAAAPAVPAERWVALIAFYAAVHCVNGYLWESRRYKPLNHAQRSEMVRDLSTLKRAYFVYRRLSRLAYDMRYEPSAVPSAAVAQDALRNLRDVERVVRAALPPEEPPVPTPPAAPTT